MNKILKRIITSLFAPVTGKRGAIASSAGILLGWIPLLSWKLTLLFVVSLLFKLNIIAIMFGIFFFIFFQNVESYIPLTGETARLLTGAAFAAVGFPIFRFFYNAGIAKHKQGAPFIFLDLSKHRRKIIKRLGLSFLVFAAFICVVFFQSIGTNASFPSLQFKGGSDNPKADHLGENILVKKIAENAAPKNIGSKEVYGFYTNWDENSKVSLEQNIDSLSVVVPEWLQLKPDLSLVNSTDPSIAALAQSHNVKVMPLINNYFDKQWNSGALHQLFSNANAENKFIYQLSNYVKQNHFAGINIDFEAVQKEDSQNLTDFIEKLAAKFHADGLTVTEDVPAADSDYDYAALAKKVDRMIVMLYDEHNVVSAPGPIASANWFKDSLKNLNLPPNKVIVSLGAFGYDWTEHSNQAAQPISFGDLMDLGYKTPLHIQWDAKSGNPSLHYQDGRDKHTIWFLDGATFYNEMKTVLNLKYQGIAIWRLGSEDPSIWKVVNNQKSTTLQTLESPNPVHYSGQGEFLKIVSPMQYGKRVIGTDSSGMITSEQYQAFPKPFEIVNYGKPKGKEVALTFDDGPDPTYTPQILKILRENHIPATFFVIGENANVNPHLIKQEYNDGDEIGNHTFTHPEVAYISPLRTKLELNANQRLIQELTGHSMTLFRAPYEADAEPSTPEELLPVLRAQSMGYTFVGELIDPNDWMSPPSSVIVQRVMQQLPNGNVILMHDAGGNRDNTVKALPIIIKELKERGYHFVTVGQLVGKSNQAVNPPASDDRFVVDDKAVFTAIQYFREGITLLFLSFIVFGVIRLALFVYLSRRQRKRQKDIVADPSYRPFVSVVLAAYNEEKVVCKTIDSILKNDYPSFEVVIVNDGSTDGTARVIQEHYHSDDQVKLISKENGGKASAINLGFQSAKGEIVVVLDADTLIAPNAISMMVPHFQNEKVAGVSGNVKVGNIRNLLTKWQHIEYVTGFNLERRAFAELNCITVVPGAIGAWRRALVKQAGYLKEDTLAEDTDITLTLLRQGYEIEFEEKAYAFTEAPEDVKSLAKQRYRWTYGTLQCLWKHKDALFNKKQKALGYIGLPNMWVFQYIYQFFAPIADLLFILALFGTHPIRAAVGFIAFYLLDLFTSVYAFRLEKESPKPLLSLFLQRILYKQVMTYVVIKSVVSAVMGVAVGWNKLKRSGKVLERKIAS